MHVDHAWSGEALQGQWSKEPSETCILLTLWVLILEKRLETKMLKLEVKSWQLPVTFSISILQKCSFAQGAGPAAGANVLRSPGKNNPSIKWETIQIKLKPENGGLSPTWVSDYQYFDTLFHTFIGRLTAGMLPPLESRPVIIAAVIRLSWDRLRSIVTIRLWINTYTYHF